MEMAVEVGRKGLVEFWFRRISFQLGMDCGDGIATVGESADSVEKTVL